MSTRALRKLQRGQLQKQVAAAYAEQEAGSEDEDEHEPVIVSKPRNAFDMLNEAEDDEVDSDRDDSHDDAVLSAPQQSVPDITQTTPSRSSKRKKKNAKKKSKDRSQVATPQQQDSQDVSEDEIDKALKELSLKNGHRLEEQKIDPRIIWEENATKYLAIDPKNLDPVNEMRGLFGNIALEEDSSSRNRNTRQRTQAQQGGVDLGTSLTGRYSVASKGKELGNLAKKRNCFMQGKEEWPLATSGGLSMEALPVTTFERHFNVMRNQIYQRTQARFEMLQRTMDPNQMIGMLYQNPYHISSLLQVSEIAKHQGDNSLSGDLLERALFTFGRSVHSTFPASMRAGTARLDFRKPANRELYMSVWRYIRNLEQRGTWKTAFEWSKLLLQFDTTSDPYGVTLMIDQLALRGRQHEAYLQLVSDEAYGNPWAHLPNIQISKVIALLRAQKPKEARQQLAIVMHKYPYIISALASAIEVSPIPKNIWGKVPSTDAEKLYCEYYVTRARDLWNTPETIGLISEVANTLQYYKSYVDQSPAPAKLQISLEEARHVILLEIPTLIALLPRSFTNMVASSSDPLPPPDSESSGLEQRAPDSAGQGAQQIPLMDFLRQMAGNAAGAGGGIFQQIADWWSRPVDPNNPDANNIAALRASLGDGATNMTDDELQQLVNMTAEIHLDEDELAQAVTGPAMAGGWDYYDAAAEHGDSGPEDPEDASDDSDMPGLEEIAEGRAREAAGLELIGVPVRNQHAATVEEADSDDDQPQNRPAAWSGPVLRRVDSNDDDEDALLIRRGPRNLAASRVPAPAPVSSATTDTQPPASQPANDKDIESDPQRLQRWLISAGLEELKASSSGNISTYVRRLKMLNKNQQGWILNMVKQRGSSDLARRVESAL